MAENSAPGREEAAPEQAEGGSALRAASEIVALISASALVGGGVGMLGGVALGAINPFALGIIGAVVGTSVPVLLAVGSQKPCWRRVFGG